MEGVLTGSLGLKPLAGRPPTKRVWGRGLPAPRCCWPGPSRSWAQTPSVASWIRVFPHRTDTWGQEGARQSGSSQDPARVPSSAPLTMCHRPARERWRLWTRSWGPGPSVWATKCPWLRRRSREGLLAVRGAASSRSPRGVRGRTSIERWDLEAKQGRQPGRPLRTLPTRPSLTSSQGVPGCGQTPGNWTGGPQTGRHLGWSWEARVVCRQGPGGAGGCVGRAEGIRSEAGMHGDRLLTDHPPCPHTSLRVPHLPRSCGPQSSRRLPWGLGVRGGGTA